MSIKTDIDTDGGGAITAEGFAAGARQRLRTLTADPDGEFREGRLEAIGDVVPDRAPGAVRAADRVGKSAVYYVATARLR